MDTPTGEESAKLLGFADFLPQLDTHSNSEEIRGTISSAGMLCNPPPPKEKSWNHFLRPKSCKKACFRIFPFFATLLNWKGKSSHQFLQQAMHGDFTLWSDCHLTGKWFARI